MAGKIRIITVHGLIGGGKSTFLGSMERAFQKHDVATVMAQEPVDEWLQLVDNVPGTSLLDKMYQAQARLRALKVPAGTPPSPPACESDEERSMSDSTTTLPRADAASLPSAGPTPAPTATPTDGTCGAFQINAFVSRSRRVCRAYRDAEKLLRAQPDRDVIVIVERSVHDDRLIMKAVGVEAGFIDEFQSHVYELVFATWIEMWDKPVSELAVYIDTSVDSAMQRIAVRDRVAEVGLPIAYQQTLKLYHDRYLGGKNTHYAGAPILRVDGERPFHADGSVRDEIAESILHALGIPIVVD
jgi:deoxyadenosine/deoxycytidine kinase